MLGSVWLLTLTLTAQVPSPHAAEARGIELRQERRAIRARETTQIQALADRLLKEGHSKEAEDVRARIEPEPSENGPTRFVPLPAIVPKPAPAAPDPAAREWGPIRADAAKALFDLAGRAATSDPRHYDLADECLRAALDRQPDHPEARRLLGFIPFEAGWATPYAVRQKQMGKTDHPTYGWVEASWVPHLEKNELPAPRASKQKAVRWLPAAEADALHAPWEDRWVISTEHFEIRTNVPLSEAIAFGRQLETFHQLFFAILADVIGGNAPIAARFRDKKMTGEPKTDPHLIDYFATRQEYLDHLSRVPPHMGRGLGQSIGFYHPPLPGKKRAPAYFFRDAGGQLPVTATLYHEVSHQLLFESAGRSQFDRNTGNYWVFEGLGTYFETLAVEPDGRLSLGGKVGPRIESARKRLIENGEHIPIGQFVRLNKERFNQDDLVYFHYQEAMALTLFLMQARSREYREPFLDYVKDAYQGRLRPESGRSLEDRLGTTYATLDDQFLKFIK